MPRPKPNDNDLYTPATLAEYWGCSERHVRNLLAEGALAHFKLGKKLIRIPGEAVDAFQAQQIEAEKSKLTKRQKAEEEALGDFLYRIETDRLLRERLKRIAEGG